MSNDSNHYLIRMQVQADRARAAERAATPRQEPLPFGDGFLDDETPNHHGTNVGLARHADAGEELCPLCQHLIDELLAAGLAVRLGPDGKPHAPVNRGEDT